MKQITLILIFAFPFISFGQFPEVYPQQERAIRFNKVKSVLVYQIDYQHEIIDTTLSRLEKYNRSGKLTEKRIYSSSDTSSYSGTKYIYDSTENRIIEKPFAVNSPSFGCPSYVGHPRKKIEKANDKEQLIFVKEIRNKDILEKRYSYNENGLLDQVKIRGDKKLLWIFKFHYTFYD